MGGTFAWPSKPDITGLPERQKCSVLSIFAITIDDDLFLVNIIDLVEGDKTSVA
jgi:hypothetical protein